MQRRTNIWVLFGLSLIISLPNSGWAKQTILVNTVQGFGITPEAQVELTRLLKREIEAFSWLGASTHVDSEKIAECMQEPTCKGKLAESKGATHLLETKIHGLGSTFSVTLKLHELDPNASKVWSSKEKGKRATATFDEIAKKALKKLVQSSSLSAKGILHLENLPPGATIVLNSKPLQSKSQKRVRRLLVSPGTHELRIEREGFKASTQTVSIEPKATARVQVQLQPQPIQVAAQHSAFHAVEFQPKPAKQERRSFFKKWWVWTIIGGVAATAATAAAIGLSGGSSDQNSNNLVNSGGGTGTGGGGGSGAGSGGGGGSSGSGGPVTIDTTVGFQ